MEELLVYIAKNIVDDPDAVSVEKNVTDDTISLILHTAKDDVGRVIGKHGRVAKEIRTLIRACEYAGGKKISVEFAE